MENYITHEDLRQFRSELINDIEKILQLNKELAKEGNDIEWLRSKAVRKIMDISPATLQNLRITGKMRHKKIMGTYYYNKEDLKQLFNEE